MQFYTYTQVARLLGLRSRSAVYWRIGELSKRGEPLSLEAGDLVQIGRQRYLTSQGAKRLQEFEKRKSGRPSEALNGE